MKNNVLILPKMTFPKSKKLARLWTVSHGHQLGGDVNDRHLTVMHTFCCLDRSAPCQCVQPGISVLSSSLQIMAKCPYSPLGLSLRAGQIRWTSESEAETMADPAKAMRSCKDINGIS